MHQVTILFSRFFGSTFNLEVLVINLGCGDGPLKKFVVSFFFFLWEFSQSSQSAYLG